MLAATLALLRTAQAPGAFAELPFAWPESVAEAHRSEEPPPPIARLLQRKPWLLPRLHAGDIPRDER